LYNIESIDIVAIFSSKEQIMYLDRIRDISGVLLNNPSELEKTKQSK